MLLFLVLACNDSKDTDSASEQEPRLENVQKFVFDRSCAFSSCHGSGGAGGLDLTPGQSHASLVNVNSLGEPTEILVVPTDPDSSYLMKKLYGETGIVGDPMPPSVALEGDMIALISDWIAAGALDN